MRGNAKGGTTLLNGEFGLQAVEPGWITSRQIEAMRSHCASACVGADNIDLASFLINLLQPNRLKHGWVKGKGSVDYWVAVVKPGRIMFEIAGVPEDGLVRLCCAQVINCRFAAQVVSREDSYGVCKMANIVELRDFSSEVLIEKLKMRGRRCLICVFQNAAARLSDTNRIRIVRREIAQMETLLHQRQLAIDLAAKQPDTESLLPGKLGQQLQTSIMKIAPGLLSLAMRVAVNWLLRM